MFQKASRSKARRVQSGDVSRTVKYVKTYVIQRECVGIVTLRREKRTLSKIKEEKDLEKERWLQQLKT